MGLSASSRHRSVIFFHLCRELSRLGYELVKTVVLVGMMGAGKTAVGTALARKLEVPFVDQDDEIQRASNSTISEIFRDYGEAFFREKETQVLERLLSGPPCVLSTGGGAFMSERNRGLIEELGVAVWLNASVELLWSRVKHRDTRPLLRTSNPLATLKEIFAERTPVYALAAIHVKAVPGRSVDEMADSVLSTLSEHPEILKADQNVPR